MVIWKPFKALIILSSVLQPEMKNVKIAIRKFKSIIYMYSLYDKYKFLMNVLCSSSPRLNINKHPDPRINLSVQYKVLSFFSRKWIWEKFWWPEQSGRCGVVFSSLLSRYQSALFVCIHDYCRGGNKPRKEKYIVQCTSKAFSRSNVSNSTETFIQNIKIWVLWKRRGRKNKLRKMITKV